MSKIIYIVEGCSIVDQDFIRWNVKAFNDLNTALDYADKCEAEAKRLTEGTKYWELDDGTCYDPAAKFDYSGPNYRVTEVEYVGKNFE